MTFTDHDEELFIDPFTYLPTSSLNATAHEMTLGLVENNRELSGPIDDDMEFTFDDLRSGRYSEAQVDELLVDWRWPWAGAIERNRYWIEQVEYDSEEFRFSLAGLVRFLRPRIGGTFTRNCRYHLGRNLLGQISLTQGCKFDVVSARVNGTVGTVITQRKKWSGTGGINQVDDFYNLGFLIWTSGANDGHTSQVADWIDTGDVITLQDKTPFDIAPGDTFTMEPGCNKTPDHCLNKFANRINYGGFDFMPGTDKLIQVKRA